MIRRAAALALFLAALALAAPAEAAWTLVQSTNHGFFPTSTKAFTSNVAAGSLLHVAGYCFGQTPTVTDTQGNTYTVKTTVGVGNSDRRIWHAYAIAGSSAANTLTFTVSGSPGCDVYMGEWTGHNASSLLDVEDPVAGATSTTPSNTITTATDGALILAVMMARSGTVTITPDACCTQVQERQTGTDLAGSLVYKVAGAAGANAMSWVISSSLAWDVYILSFKPAATCSGSMLLMGIGSC